MNKSSIKKVTNVLGLLGLIVCFIYFTYRHMVYELPNIVDGTIVELKLTPEYNPYEEKISKVAPLSPEIYQSESYFFALKANYKKQGNEYVATYGKYFEDPTSIELKRYMDLKVGDIIDIFIDHSDNAKILSISDMPNDEWPRIILCLLGLCIYIEVLNKDKALIYKNEKRDSNDICFKPIWKRRSYTGFYLSLQMKNKLLMFQPTIILTFLLLFSTILSLILLLVLCFMGESLWRDAELGTAVLPIIVILCGWIAWFVYFTYPIFANIIHIDKDENILWKGFFRLRKNMEKAIPLSSIKNIQIINYRTLTPFPAFQLNLITSDGQRSNLANVMNSKYVIKKLTSLLQVPVIKSTDTLKPQIMKLFPQTTELSWSPGTFFYGYFNKIIKREGLVFLKNTGFENAINFGIFSLISFYCFYVLKFYPSRYNISTLWLVLLVLIIILYYLFNAFFPKYFNQKQNKFYNRQLFNPFSKIDLNDIACLQLLCSVGVKENSSYLCLNLVSKQGKRFNLSSTIDYQSIKQLSNDLAKAINKPLLVDPIIEEIEASNNIA